MEMAIRKFLKFGLLVLVTLLLLFGSYFFIGNSPQVEKITWGVNFSQKHAQNLGLDWRENYLALVDDLQVKNIKLATHWDLIEPEKDKYKFEDLDWQIKIAEAKGVELLLVIGMKTPRWPECHMPAWARNLSKKEQQEEILQLIENIVLRYQNSESIWAWQVENEPFFPFGQCPWIDKNFLKKEINLVRSLDASAGLVSTLSRIEGVDFKTRPIIISDSGEMSLWFKVSQLGDIVGTTLYRRVWFKEFENYTTYPFPPVYYWRKAQLIKKLFGKPVICVEFQAEPWGPVLLYDLPLEEQKKTMDLKQFRENIEFAKQTGFDTFYLWGAEWWFWMKVRQNDHQIWEEAKKLFLE